MSPNGTPLAAPDQPAVPALKLKACAKLHPAVVVGCLRHVPEAAILEAGIWKRESLVIGDVEHLGANLQVFAFADLELFRERHIDITNPIAA